MKDIPFTTETIAAVATPPGRGGVGVIRVSGPESLSLACSLFRSPLPEFQGPFPYRMHHGWITDEEGHDLDEVMLCFMPGPKSFTGENVVEFHCHGSPAVLQAVLGNLFRLGARPAGPGEFTARAFLNGRMDLSQAEAVAEMINASTLAGVRLAGEKLKGALGERVRQLRGDLEDLRGQLCLAVDFPEEEVECLSRATFLEQLSVIRRAVERFLVNARQATVWREGALVVLAGKVNAGKSSLLNALLGRERAIVTSCPGTTKDFLEEMVDIAGLPVRLVDTAGLRPAADEVERIGQEMGRELMGSADLILLLFDSTVAGTGEELEFLQDYDKEKLVAVANKIDLGPVPEAEEPYLRKGIEVVRISAKHGNGLGLLTDSIHKRIMSLSGGDPQEGMVAPNLRQQEILRKTLDELLALEGDIGQEVPDDLLGVRLEMVCQTLSELTGEITSQEVPDGIFDTFCIGK
jgi:tRNA modification GTPase